MRNIPDQLVQVQLDWLIGTGTSSGTQMALLIDVKIACAPLPDIIGPAAVVLSPVCHETTLAPLIREDRQYNEILLSGIAFLTVQTTRPSNLRKQP